MLVFLNSWMTRHQGNALLILMFSTDSFSSDTELENDSEQQELLYVYNAIMKLSPGFPMVLAACRQKPTALLAWINKVSNYMPFFYSTFTFNDAYISLLRQQIRLGRTIRDD